MIRAMLLALFSFMMFEAVAFSATSSAQFSWPRPAYSSNKYQIEISKDPSFSKILLRGKATKSEYFWTNPEQGVWHWRVKQEGRNDYFCRGSFGVMPKTESGRSYSKITWRKGNGSEKVAIQTRQDKLMRVIDHSRGSSMTMRNSNAALQIVIARVLTGKLKSRAVDTTFWPNMHIALQNEQGEGKLLTFASQAPASRSNAQSLPVSVKAEKKSGHSSIVETKSTTNIDLYGLMGRPRLVATKSELDLDATAEAIGGGFTLSQDFGRYLNVSSQLQVLHLDGTADVGGDQEGTYVIEDEQYYADLSAQFQLVNLATSKFSVGPVVSYSIMPTMTNNFDGLSATVPELESRQSTSFGLGANYRLNLSRFALGIQSRYLKSPSEAFSRASHMIDGGIVLASRYELSTGVLYYDDRQSHCHDDPTICKAEGRVEVRQTSLLGLLGLGLLF